MYMLLFIFVDTNIYYIHKYNCSILINYYAYVEFFPHVIEIISCLATAYHN